MEFSIKHYIVVNTDNFIIRGFSTAFEEPSETDICICEEGGRHFELLGQTNPQLTNNNGCYLYKYVNDEIVVLSDEEIQSQLDATQLSSFKAIKITDSTSKLEVYLRENPYLFTDGKYYSVTKDKQNLLANAIAVYQMKVQAGDQNAVIKWNATGEECSVYDIATIVTLAIAISEYVQPLVAKQQSFETAIKACTTIAELNEVVIDYATTN